MQRPREHIEFDENSPEWDPERFSTPVLRFGNRIIPPRKSPTDPFDPELLAWVKARTPHIQMEPKILGGLPVFAGTLVPVKRMFDYLLAGKSMDEFVAAYPAVTRTVADIVRSSSPTLFYEAVSKALDTSAPSLA